MLTDEVVDTREVEAVNRLARALPGLVIACIASVLLWSMASESHAEGEARADGGPHDGSPAGTRGTIDIVVTGFKTDRGQACASLYDGPDGYPREPAKAIGRECAPISAKQSTISFEDLPYGTYAAFAFHDEDGNNTINANRLGMPREPVGASNNAKGRFGPPSFDDASFPLDAPHKVVPIEVRAL